jgi:hypothetical protein
MSAACANDRIWYAIVRRTPLHSSFGTDEANDGATVAAIVRRTPLHSSFGTDEANDGATVAAIVRTWLSYTLTPPRKVMGGGTTINLSLRNMNRDEERPLVKISAT